MAFFQSVDISYFIVKLVKLYTLIIIKLFKPKAPLFIGWG